MVQLICPHLGCRKVLDVHEELRAKLVRCEHCQTVFRVPERTPRRTRKDAATPDTVAMEQPVAVKGSRAKGSAAKAS
ncbi:MAG: hypothetical protein ACFCVE_10910 [Phycisphaerae bacterium]